MPKDKSLLHIPPEYLDTIPVGNRLFSPLYQFENGLRLVIHKHLSDCYGANWWDDKLKYELPQIYEYATEQKAKSEAMPWIGDSPRIKVLPIHRITLGQLEEIVKKFASDCIPQLFPTLNFFPWPYGMYQAGPEHVFSHVPVYGSRRPHSSQTRDSDSVRTFEF